MKTLSVLFLVSLAGCASSPDYSNYLTAQAQANAAHTQKPLLVLEGYNGQPITGLARVEVNMPTNAPIIQQARENEWARVVGQAIGMVGVVGGVYATGKAMSDVAGVVGQSSTTGYQYIQASPTIVPQANVTTTNTTTTTDNSITGSYNPSTTTDNHSNQNNPISTYSTIP